LRDAVRYHRIGHDPRAIEHLFVDLFLEAHDKPPARITLDLDASDDPIHGNQQGRFFHGYNDGYCYLPLYFSGDHLPAAKLRRANIDASAGAVEEIARIIGRIRAARPRVKILLRADKADGVKVRLDDLRAHQRAASPRARPHRPRAGYLRHNPDQALEDRRPDDGQRPPRPRRHDSRLPAGRGLSPRASPIMRLTRLGPVEARPV
jgi:hypothetical protein